MKHDHNHDHAKSEGPHSLPVRFAVSDSTAGRVPIAGTFNNWQAEAKPMHPVGNGRWGQETEVPIGHWWTGYGDPIRSFRKPFPIFLENELGPERELAQPKPPTAQPEIFKHQGETND